MPKRPRISAPRLQTETYTSGHASNWVYNALPSPATSLYGLVMAGSITGLAYFVGDKWFNGSGALWSVIAISIMTVIGVIAFAVRAAGAKRAAARQSGGFEAALRASTSGWEVAANDPAEIARLDDLRANFLKGIQTFVDYGKDLYSLPWYIMVGEPASGKSEAIRRSELRFPQMLHDKLQGMGGTYSMNWWFTNSAVILDTAGAMLMQAEATARFQEFLNLLRTYRPACPINGMILTLPTDSLLADSPADAEQKARTIAGQLAVIQKALDVRFPIYLMISKSDRLPGFREFFDAQGQGAFERQMLGWSNPDPLDQPFSSEKIYGAIDAIAWRLQGRSLALIADPVPQTPSGRRMDETDTIYGFPHVLRSLAPRLKLYLDIIFQSGTWASKPPFFRGLFFTSALREGAEIDLQLAGALGIPLNQLPPGGIFTREKSVFLRDLFTEKIFQESGLVTRLFDVGKHLRKRLTTFYGAAFALVLLAVGFALLVADRIGDQLRNDQVIWAAANGTWSNGAFLPVVTRSSAFSETLRDRPAWNWTAQNRVTDDETYLDLLEQIRARAWEPIPFSWVFEPLPEWRDFIRRRQEAAYTLVEGGIMKPILDAARERILWDTSSGSRPSAETQVRMAKACQSLVRLETWLKRDAIATPDEKMWKDFFKDLLSYILDPAPPGGWPDGADLATAPKPQAPPDIALQAMSHLMATIYGPEIALPKRSWMSETRVDDLPMAESALAKAADFVLGVTRQEAEQNDQRRNDALSVKRAAMKRIVDAEEHLLEMSKSVSNGPRQRVDSEGLRPLKQAVQDYQTTMGGGVSRSALSMDIVRSVAKTIDDAAGVLGDEAPEGLRQGSALARKVLQGGGGSIGDSAEIDVEWAAVHKRLTEYEAAFKEVSLVDANLSMENLVGNLVQKLNQAQNRAVDLGKSPEGAAKADAPKVDQIVVYLRKFRATPLVDRVWSSYHSQLLAYLQPKLMFPLVNCAKRFDSRFLFEQECENLKKVEADIEGSRTLTEPIFLCKERTLLENLFARLKPVFLIKSVLIGEGDQAKMWIEVDAIQPPKETSRQRVEPPPFSPLAGTTPAPAAPQTTVVETIREGFLLLRITVGGTVLRDEVPKGQSVKDPYNGFDPVSVSLKRARPAPANEELFTFDTPRDEPWPLLWRMANERVSAFRIGGSGKFLKVSSSPALPLRGWPTRTELGLSAEP